MITAGIDSDTLKAPDMKDAKVEDLSQDEGESTEGKGGALLMSVE